MKKLLTLFLFLLSLFFGPTTFAADNSFVSIVNPVRGSDFWELKSQKPNTAVKGEIQVLSDFNLPATWLLRFDALGDKEITDELKKRDSDEKGLFLEVTPSWAKIAEVSYRQSNIWHSAGSAFLTGYEPAERERLIDAAFNKFKNVFGFYPASVGAWWIDSHSLGYVQQKYGVSAALSVADQYSTDNYQIWGQYFSTPYYPSRNNALHPAQTIENKLDVVITQWAARDPVNAYGNGVFESTFSVQANDYMDYHNLDTKYFAKLVDIYTGQKFNQFGHLVVGLENSYDWTKYAHEYKNQITALAGKKNSALKIVTLKDFARWYKAAFPKLSPGQVIIADDPLGGFKKTVWFMNPYYRAGWFFNENGSVFRDIRQYIDGEEELCLRQRCDSVNFATSATRVLDEISFGNKWLINEGKINNIKVEKKIEEFILSYANEAGTKREIGFGPRDIRIDNKIFSIDSAILNAVKDDKSQIKNSAVSGGFLKWSFGSVLPKTAAFLIFLLFAVISPGLAMTARIFNDKPFLLKLFLSSAIGLVFFTFAFYLMALFEMKQLIFIYVLINFIIFLRFKLYKIFLRLPKVKDEFDFLLITLILAGVVFQVIPTFKSGLNFGYGTGFWGPNTHDGVWHIGLINELLKSVPPQNPIFSGTTLKNYHFFYDLFAAGTNYLTQIPAADLLFRFYPIIFSLMLGIGSYYLIMRFAKSKIAGFFGLYLIYFAGSFGWIVEFLRERHFGGESAFWVNQAVSFNLNPPFAVSLIILIALLHILFNLTKSLKERNIFLAIILAGFLIGFKSYGAILVLASLLLVGLIKKQLSYLIIFGGAVLISILIFLPNFDVSANLLIFAPFWFIHSMVDSPDRVGWVRLTLAREVGFAANNWFKLIGAEVLSLVIFIVGNLGLRIISLLSLAKMKSIIEDDKLLFIFVFAFLSFLIPILFIQSGNPWNTIQFSYYGIYIAALISGVVLSKVLKFSRYISVPIILIILILAPINSVVTANGYLGKNPHAFIPAKEVEALQFLSGQPYGVVLTFPFDEKLRTKIAEPWPILAYDSTAYVSAYSAKPVYLEDLPQNQILLTDYKKRIVASKDFFLKPVAESREFLQTTRIEYIYLPKIFNVRLDEDSKIVKNIFENEETVIYKVNYGN